MFAIIAALSLNHTIGRNNDLPWQLSHDLKHFKKMTLGHRLIMGRTTFESIGKPLPKRENYILTRQHNYQHAAGALLCPDDEHLQLWQKSQTPTFICGGSQVYDQFLPYCDIMYLTWVLTDIEGDTHFPELSHADWQLIEFTDHDQDTQNEYPHKICTYKRKTSPKVFTSLKSMV